MSRQRLILIVCCVAQLLVVLDSSILTVALPQLAAELGFTQKALPWVVNAFAIPLAGLLLLGGQLADVFGARRVLIVGVYLFAAASLAGGIARTGEVLIGARAAQGAGAALMAPATLALLSQSFPSGPQRARAFGLWGAAAGSGGAIGVLAGGLIVEWANWRWTLLVNVPLCLALVLTLILGMRGEKVQKNSRRLDLVGALLITATVAAITTGIASLNSSTTGWVLTGWFCVAVIAMALFVCFELRWARQPLLPLQMILRGRLWEMPVAILLVGGAMTGTFYFLTLHLQVFRDLPPLATGLSFLPLSVAAFLAEANTPILVRAVGGLRSAISGVAVMAISLFAVALTADLNGVLWIVLTSGGFGVGMGIAISTLEDLTTSSFPPQLSGIASGLLTTAQQMGNTIGLATIVTLDLHIDISSHGPAFLGASTLAVMACGWLIIRASRRTRYETAVLSAP